MPRPKLIWSQEGKRIWRVTLGRVKISLTKRSTGFHTLAWIDSSHTIVSFALETNKLKIAKECALEFAEQALQKILKEELETTINPLMNDLSQVRKYLPIK